MKLAVLGAAESGVGAAILAQQKGYDVFVSDAGQIREHYKALLNQHQLSWEEGGHTAEKILVATEVVKSPGIPDDAPMVVALRERGVPILSEIEFAARYTRAKMLCITGSNGKTTTTSLVYHIMEQAGFDVGLAGNIGRSLALQVAEIPERGDREWYVLEISSFQLDNMYDFRAHIAVLLNITPDHLDRYNYEMARYVASKMRITRHQRPDDYFIYWADDPHIAHEVQQSHFQQQLLPFTDTATAHTCAYGAGETVAEGGDSYGFAPQALLKVEQPQAYTLPLTALPLPGRHNLRNYLAAAVATLAAGISPEQLTRGIESFKGVAHRLEFVGTFGGVHYINDSKATNVDACYVALQAQTTPTVLIVGGLDKGNDYTTLYELIRQKCRALVFLGADNSILHRAFDDFAAQHAIPIADTHSMASCVAACQELAQSGDTVLLSPCCASFDLFTGMADRGNQFKQLVTP